MKGYFMKKQIFKFTVVLVLFLSTLLTGFLPFSTLKNYRISADNKQNIFVSADEGSDSNPGSMDKPFKTIQKAVDSAGPGSRILVREGIYRESVRVNLTGSESEPIIIEAYENEEVILSGLEEIKGNWSVHEGNIYKIKTDLPLGSMTMIFSDKEKLMPARWPNVGSFLERSSGIADTKSGRLTNTSLYDGDMPDIDWSGGKLWVYVNWFGWTSEIVNYANRTLTIVDRAPDEWTQLGFNTGSTKWYYIYDHLAALDAEREWYYDKNASELYVYLPGGKNPDDVLMEKNVRRTAMDLSGSSFVHVKNIHIMGADLKGSSVRNILLDGLNIQDYGFDADNINGYGSQGNIGITFSGHDVDIRNSEISGASGNGLKVKGDRAVLFNNYIHDIGYSGTFSVALIVDGSDAHIVHNTVTRTGASAIGGNYLYHSIIEYNDFSNCGMVSYDNGTMHWAKNDYGNTEIRYNDFREGRDGAAYVYIDNACSNLLVHHNNIYDIHTDRGQAIGINHPGNYIQIYENSVEGSFRSVHGHVFVDDTYKISVYNNKFSEGYRATGPAIIRDNTIQDFEMLDFPGGKPGHNFENPPVKPDLVYSDNKEVNLVKNAGFEQKLGSEWIRYGIKKAVLQGAKGDSINQDKGFTRTGDNSVRLREGNGMDGIMQIVENLTPDSYYEFAGWIKVEEGEEGRIGIRDYGGEELSSTVTDTKEGWERHIFFIKTGPSSTSATVFLEKTTSGPNNVYGDDFGLVYLGDTLPPPPPPAPGENIILDTTYEADDQAGETEAWEQLKDAEIKFSEKTQDYSFSIKEGGQALLILKNYIKAGEAYIIDATGLLSEADEDAAGLLQVRCLDEDGKLLDKTMAEAVLSFSDNEQERKTLRLVLPEETAAVRIELINTSEHTFDIENLAFRENANLIKDPGYEDSVNLLHYDSVARSRVVEADGTNEHLIYEGRRALGLEPTAGSYADLKFYVMTGAYEKTRYRFSVMGMRGEGDTDGRILSILCQEGKGKIMGGWGKSVQMSFEDTEYTKQSQEFLSFPNTKVFELAISIGAGKAPAYFDNLELYELADEAVPTKAFTLDIEGDAGDSDSSAAAGFFKQYYWVLIIALAAVAVLVILAVKLIKQKEK